MFASERHSVSYSPGEAGWVITEGECPGILFSFIKDVDGTTWRGIKVSIGWGRTNVLRSWFAVSGEPASEHNGSHASQTPIYPVSTCLQ